MKKLLLPLSLLVFILSSCTNADPKKMAADVCDCMDPAIGSLSSKAKKIIIKAFKDGDVQTIVQQELTAIEDEAQRTKIQTEINKAGKQMEGKKMQSCLEDIDKKYKVMKSDVEKKQEELISELKDQCEAGAYIFKYGLDHKDDAAKEKNTDDETTDEEANEPKKKKKVDEEEEQ